MNLFEVTVQGSQGGGGLALDFGSQTLELPVAAVGGALAAYRSRTIALGIRPEYLLEPAARGAHPRLRATIELVERLGSDRLVHMHLPGRPVVTDDVLETARDVDNTRTETLHGEHRQGTVGLIARYAPEAESPAGATQNVGIRPEKTHFFDLKTSARIEQSSR